MSRKSINFEDQKLNKSSFYKNKKLFNIHDLHDFVLQNHIVQKIHLNALLDIMMMMSLDHYV